MMDYATFKTAADTLSKRLGDASAARDSVRDIIAAELGIPATGQMGLTQDAIKSRLEYRAACSAEDSAFAALRRFNGQYAGRFKNERRADIDAKRRARLRT